MLMDKNMRKENSFNIYFKQNSSIPSKKCDKTGEIITSLETQ